MKNLYFLLSILAAVALSATLYKLVTPSPRLDNRPGPINSNPNDPSIKWYMWKKWKMDHGRTYGTQTDEVAKHTAWLANYDHIQKVNSQNRSYRLGLNDFSDMTKEEFVKKYLGTKPGPMNTQKVENFKNLKVADSTDWTSQGAVSRVKDQGHCGSCWAFSAVGALESHQYLRGNYLFDFSEQQMVDCAKGSLYPAHGCSGGLMNHAFDYVKDHGIAITNDYPYTGQDLGTCHDSDLTKQKVNTGYSSVEANNSVALKAAIYQQPVSVAIEADALMSYSSGIYDGWTECGTQLNHGVLAVGYGVEGNTMFWKVKNSWGAGWGESGYFRLGRKDDTNDAGMCGIAMRPMYPTSS